MITLDNKNRLIGDFFEINSSIAYEESSNTKTPKFIVKWRAKRQRKKLLTIIHNLSLSDYVLTRDNIYELLVYLYNNKDIYNADNKIKVYLPNDGLENDRIEGLILLDDLKCLIHIDHNNDYIEFTLETKSKSGNISKVEINRKTLADKSGIANESLERVNRFLLYTIYDFLEFNINKYIGG
jgi:hypothetical protein